MYSIIIWLLATLFNGIHSFLPDTLGDLINKSIGYMGRYSVMMLIVAVGVFNFFKHMRIEYFKIVNNVAALTFGIYLFHENPVFNITRIIYNLNPSNIVILRLIYAFFSVIVIFLLGMVAETIRKKVSNMIEEKIVCLMPWNIK